MSCAVPGCGGPASDVRHPFCRSHYFQLLPPARKALMYAHRRRPGDGDASGDARWRHAVDGAVAELRRPPAWS